MYEQLVKEYQEKYQFTWTGLLGFSDAYGLAVRKEIAEQYNLKTYSDLAGISNQLVFGAEYDFMKFLRVMMHYAKNIILLLRILWI